MVGVINIVKYTREREIFTRFLGFNKSGVWVNLTKVSAVHSMGQAIAARICQARLGRAL